MLFDGHPIIRLIHKDINFLFYPCILLWWPWKFQRTGSSWSTEIYGNLLGSIDYDESDIYDSRDILLTLNKNNSIPEWQLTGEEYRTNYEELIRTKWAINIFSMCLKQSDFVFKNLDSYRGMNVELRKEIKKYLDENK